MNQFDFRELVERLPLVVYVDNLDEKSSPVYVSPQIERLLGYTAEEWVANPDLFVESIHPEDRERVLAEIAHRNATGSSGSSADYRLLARDGRIVWVCDDELAVTDEDGIPVAAHGYLQDVSARRYDRMRLELLAGILRLAAEELPPARIVSKAAGLLAEALGDVRVTFVEIDGDDLHARYSTGAKAAVVDTFRIPGYVEKLAAGPVVVDDVTQAPWLGDVQETLAEQRIGSAVDIPLRREGEVVGVLWFNTQSPRRWSPLEVATLAEVSEQLAMVLERAEARKGLRGRDRILEAVSRAAEHLLHERDVSAALERLMRMLGEATLATSAYVFENVPLPGGSVGALRTANWTDERFPDASDVPRLGPLAPAPHFPRWAEVLGRGDVLSGLVRDLPDEEREPLSLAGSRSFVAVPVFVGEEWWGFIGLEDVETDRGWSAAEIEALRAAAGLVAGGVERARAEAALRRKDAILEAVSTSAELLLSEPCWRDAAPEVLRLLGEGTAASRAYLFETVSAADAPMRMSQRFEWVAAGARPELDNAAFQDFGLVESGLARVEERLRAHQVFTTGRGDALPEELHVLENGEIRSIVVVPVVVDGACWGSIGFDDCVGERAWSQAEIDALRAAAGVFAAAIERERSERTLREHEQKLRAVFDTALDAIFITDDERRYLDVNPAACAYYGVAKRDLIGKRIDDFLPPHRLETLERDWAEYLAGGPVVAEWEVQCADGTLKLAEASAHPHFLPGLHIAFFRDVTERRQLEAELAHAQKLESLGRLAGGVAHDFNNLLTGITGYSSLLLERTQEDPDVHRDLTEIKRAADRAAELTRQLLAFGRRQLLSPQPVDLNAVVAEVTAMLRRLLGESIELVLRTADDLGTVRADPGQLEQVIVNLAVNARDAMPAGGTLTLETRNAGDCVELVVGDDGVGMDEDTRARIFDPFFTTRDEGVGLGLASVYGIVHQSGGSVAVESEPGAGSTFTVSLPCVPEVAETQALPAEVAVTPGSETVLLVEDEDVVRDLTRRVLERHGYTVIACADGNEALEVAGSHGDEIHLLLTDVVMPGLRGYEVAELVSASRPGIEVLYMSGYAEDALAAGASIGRHALIEKPFAVDTLARRVREALTPVYAAEDSPASS